MYKARSGTRLPLVQRLRVHVMRTAVGHAKVDCLDDLLRVEQKLVEAKAETNGSEPVEAERSRSVEARPLLSPLTSLFVLLSEVPCVANHVTAPKAAPVSTSSKRSSVMLRSVSFAYRARSSSGLRRYAAGDRLRLAPSFAFSL